MSNNINKKNKMHEIMQKKISANLFSSLIVGAIVSAVSAVVAVKVKERINRNIEECKVNNNFDYLCGIILNPIFESVYFFILTFITALFFGVLFYYIFDKK